MITKSHLRRESKGFSISSAPQREPRVRSSSASSCEEVDYETFFSKSYVPLSNLPTPPPSRHSTNTDQSFAFPGQILDPELFGPAIHLANLIPPSTSLITPSVQLIHTILTRADLPLETIALGACILNSLNSYYAKLWRQNCPLVFHDNLSRQTMKQVELRHIDTVQPELIAISALILAVKFSDDAQQSTKEYASIWGMGLWTNEQINFTQYSIMENIGYSLLPLWEESVILEALEEMEKARRQHPVSDEYWDSDTGYASSGSVDAATKKRTRMNSENAVLCAGAQTTPAETPFDQNIIGTSNISTETRKAFSPTTRNTILQLPDRTLGAYFSGL